ncbi:MAG TPA: ABC transporter permease [Anaerolineae bacterium]|nr:ABC transporter permease [Anaerolineae bacterium]
MNDKKTFLEKFKEFIKNQPLIFILIGLCTVVSIVSPSFLLSQNLINVLIQISINALIATGMTLVIISGGIDLSVGSVAALNGIVVTAFIQPFVGISILLCVLVIIVLSVIMGFICGSISGFTISRLRVPPFVATLAMMNIARGFTYVYTKSRSIYGLPEAFGWIGQGYIGFIPVIVIIVIIVLLIAHIVLDRTVFGRYVYAIGSNEEVAKICGINVRNIKLIVYILSGMLSALAGACLASRLITGQPTAAQGYELNAIAAVVLGTGGMSGGRGGIGKTIQGILIIGVINNGLNLMRVSSYWQIITMGAIILVALIIGQFKKED